MLKKKPLLKSGGRLNFETPGLSSIFRKSARNIKKVDDDLLNVLVSHFAIVADTSGLGAFLADKKDRLDEETTTAARQALIEVDKNGANRIFGVISNIFPAITLADIFFVPEIAAYSSSQDAFKRQEEKETNLCALIYSHPHSVRHHYFDNYSYGVSGCFLAVQHTVTHIQPTDDFGFVAVLDFAFSAHLFVDCAVARKRRG